LFFKKNPLLELSFSRTLRQAIRYVGYEVLNWICVLEMGSDADLCGNDYEPLGFTGILEQLNNYHLF
jgi:hypothetical protein